MKKLLFRMDNNVKQKCQIPWVKDTGGERNHEKVVEGGPSNVHQDAPEGHMAAKKENEA